MALSISIDLVVLRVPENKHVILEGKMGTPQISPLWSVKKFIVKKLRL